MRDLEQILMDRQSSLQWSRAEPWTPSEEISRRVPRPAVLEVVMATIYWLLMWPHRVELWTHDSSLIFLSSTVSKLFLIPYCS